MSRFRSLLEAVAVLSVLLPALPQATLVAQAPLAVRNMSRDTVPDPESVAAQMNAVVSELDLYAPERMEASLRALIDSTRRLALRVPILRSPKVRDATVSEVMARL